jgi:MFS family permease
MATAGYAWFVFGNKPVSESEIKREIDRTYGIGAVLSAVSPGLGVLILGNSILEGVGTALLIPPVYILTTMVFPDMKSRARAFG